MLRASVVAAGETPIAAAALVSPALRLASIVAANERRFAVTYPWSDDARSIAAELGFVANAPELARRDVPTRPELARRDVPTRPELARRDVPTLLVVGVDDEADAFVRPAEASRRAQQRGSGGVARAHP